MAAAAAQQQQAQQAQQQQQRLQQQLAQQQAAAAQVQAQQQQLLLQPMTTDDVATLQTFTLSNGNGGSGSFGVMRTTGGLLSGGVQVQGTKPGGGLLIPKSSSLYIKNLPADADKCFLYERFGESAVWRLGGRLGALTGECCCAGC